MLLSSSVSFVRLPGVITKQFRCNIRMVFQPLRCTYPQCIFARLDRLCKFKPNQNHDYHCFIHKFHLISFSGSTHKIHKRTRAPYLQFYILNYGTIGLTVRAHTRLMCGHFVYVSTVQVNPSSQIREMECS